ncbi:MAG: hypothetical protein ACOCSL_04785 [Thermoplasmatota archaeon]
MDKRLSSIGFVLLIIGILLIVAFWPVYGTSARDIEKKDGEFKEFDSGDKVTVHGTITQIKESDFPSYIENLGVEDNVLFELDGNIWVIVKGKNSIHFQEGEEVYCIVVLQEVESFGNSYEYWQLGKDQDIHLKNNLNYVFYFIAGTGTVISSAGFVKE